MNNGIPSATSRLYKLFKWYVSVEEIPARLLSLFGQIGEVRKRIPGYVMPSIPTNLSYVESSNWFLHMGGM
ncbi:hypothetical protein [Candidatus Glomeribacter gigasporarum]|uniref:hypothetical protein n=1 Tax=Candidatus Glomeribacter gigasporarum TaxID=132144 RepID=UPI001939BEE8|nr:hypothetical protein [Candidatus Glomeribacter gigasporarum]